MKKIYLQQAICFTSLAMMFSCASEDLTEEYRDKQITMTGHDFRYDIGSRTSFEVTDKGVGFKWAANDTVGIIPDEGAQVYFPMMDGAGTQTAAFNGGGWALKPSSSYAAYYPFVKNYDINKKALPIDFTGQKQIGTASTTHLGKHDIMTAVATTPADGSVNFDFQHLGSLIAMDLVVPKAGDVGSVLLSADEELFTDKGVVDLTAENPQITPIQRSKTIAIELENIVTSKDGEQITVYFMMAPGDYTGKPIKLSVINNAVKYTGSIAINKLDAGVAYNYKASLAGQKPIDNNYYITKPGTLREIIGEENMYNITELTVSGKINQDDLSFIGKMAWKGKEGYLGKGKLVKLNLAESQIVSRYNYENNDVIGNSDFSNTILTHVILPNSLKELGYGVFENCSELTEIILPATLKGIGYNAFYGCSSLIDINIPSSVSSIGSSAFRGCSNLSKLVLPAQLTSIPDGLVSGCSFLTEINIPSSVSSIGSNAFSGCSNLSKLVLPAQLTSIPDGLVSECTALIDINIPSGVTVIGNDAFQNCIYLSNLELPNGVKSIGNSAFSGCKAITSFKIPAGVTAIGSNAFSGCSGLSEIVLPEGITIIEGGTFSECSGLSTINIPSKVTKIGENAFHGCNGLVNVEIPEGVTELGRYCFGFCQNLETIKLPNSLKKIEGWAFTNSNKLTKVNLPNGIETIGEHAFFYTELTEVTIPESVINLGDFAFQGCGQLKTITVNAKIKILPEAIFRHCYSCEKLLLPNTLEQIRTEALSFNDGYSDRDSVFIYCPAVNPPVLYVNNKIPASAKIYVPKESVELYKTAKQWSEFASLILPIPDSTQGNK